MVHMEKTDLNEYLALPAGGKGPGLLVIHAWWGLNAFIKRFCDRLAGEGFVALAPDLYGGRVAVTIDEAKVLRSKMNQQQAHQKLLDAVERLRGMACVSGESTGVVGFSLGARFALELSAEEGRPIHSVVVFYGNSGVDYSAARAAYLGHFAEHDDYVALSGVKKLEKALRAAGRPFAAHIYPGTGHWFFEADRPEAYEPQAAQLAWERTVDFLNAQMRG